tara:strand:- start:42050 stop:42541 length:492 start_codon:yes stop_codon:yes gene_type:complete
MSSLSLNSSAYRRKMMIGEHKKVKPMDNQSEGRSKDSEVGQEEKDKKIVDDKEKEKKKIKQELSVSIPKNYPIIKSIKKVFYIKLNYPEKKELNIDYKTGDIITNILDIPENYLGIICFDPKTFPKDNDRANLYDVAYWLANDNCVTYISMGKTVSLLKNDSI